MTVLAGGMSLMSGCDGEDRTMALAEETKALENTSNKVGNSINAITASLPAFERADLRSCRPIWMSSG